MNAVKFLINEHNMVKNIFSQIEKNIDDTSVRNSMFEGLCHDLIVHEKVEETVWYPYLLQFAGFEDIIDHLVSEEKAAEKTIKKFKTLTNQSQWINLFQKLKSDVTHHSSEEEHNLFPKVLEQFKDSELVDLGTEMKEFKQKQLLIISKKNIAGAEIKVKLKPKTKLTASKSM